ncbi:unnamed protein product [Schistocephalus solidus]|uniref:Reverse transcriptase domain-containing protein n=1 Tax=Schistocephalus solidus TaxID=70667 RepID=A0A3P7D678_SCHSO|nr:unnamed protein product [Schistocephalus solidus]
MARHKVDIAALSETRFSEQGQLDAVGAGYNFFWSGQPKAERRDAGIVCVIRKDILARLPCLPQAINDRMTNRHLLIQEDKFATIISAYAPPMTTSDVTKTPEIRIAYRMGGRFFNQRRMHFHSRVSTATIHKLFFADDCALSATTEWDMENSMGLFIATCENFGLHINTEKIVIQHARAVATPSAHELPWSDIFGCNATTIRPLQILRQLLPTLHRTPHGHYWHQFPHSNHHGFDRRFRRGPPYALYQVVQGRPVICESIARKLVNQCLEHQPTVEIAAFTALTALERSLTTWAYTVTGASMTAEFTALLTTAIPYDTSQVWWYAEGRFRPRQPPATSLISGLLACVVRPGSAIKAIYGPCIKGSAPLLSSDGTTLLTEKSQILKRWAEHFRSVLNCSSAISDAAIDRLPQVDTNNDLDLPPSLPETIRAVQQISSGKAPGSDAIPPEVYKHGGPRLMAELTTLFQEMWRQGQVPQDFKDATIVHLYKRKGNRQLCDNHRGISLLNIAGKIFARILLNRLNGHLEQGLLPESQCGFRRHRGITDMIFAARQLQEKRQDMRTHIFTTFVDLTKAFDTLNRDGLWKVMQTFGCPERFTHMVRQLHDGMTARVTDNGTVSEAFAVTNGVKQGCVLAPTLFSLMFSAMLMDAYRDEQPGIRIAYRTDGHLLNSRRMHYTACDRSILQSSIFIFKILSIVEGLPDCLHSQLCSCSACTIV